MSFKVEAKDVKIQKEFAKSDGDTEGGEDGDDTVSIPIYKAYKGAMLYDDAIKELTVANGDGFSGSKFIKKLKELSVDEKSEKVIVIAEMERGDDG